MLAVKYTRYSVAAFTLNYTSHPQSGEGLANTTMDNKILKSRCLSFLMMCSIFAKVLFFVSLLILFVVFFFFRTSNLLGSLAFTGCMVIDMTGIKLKQRYRTYARSHSLWNW